MNKWIACMILLGSLVACDALNKKKDKDLVAEAYGRKLYRSDVETGIGNFKSPVDSQFAASRFVNEWIMDAILFEEAKASVKDKYRIQALVKDYEQSLYITELENNMVQNELDTSIAQTAINSFYAGNEEDFQLHEHIVRMLFIRVDSTQQNDTLENLWKTEDLPALKSHLDKIGALAVLDPDEWHYISELRSLTPKNLFDKISLNQASEYAFEENDQHFYLKILEVIDKDNLPPVSFVKERIRMRILQDRLKSLLKRKRSELFNEKIRSKQIKIYGNENI